MNPTSALPFLLISSVAVAQFYVRNGGPQPPHFADEIVYDSVRGRMVGLFDSGTFEFDGVRWHDVVTPLLPQARYEHAMAFDGTRVLLYGGQDAPGISALGDFWAYDGSNWAQLPQPGANPGLRRSAAMAHDIGRARTVLFGGTDMLNGFPADTWEWDGMAWNQMPWTGPGARVWHNLVYEPVAARIVLYGGALNPMQYQDTWEYDGASWTMTNVNQAPPRYGAGLVYDLVLQRVVLLGGFTAPWGDEDTYTYDSATGAWTNIGATYTEWFTAAEYDPVYGRTVVLTQNSIQNDAKTVFFYSSGTLTASVAPFGQGCPGGPSIVNGRVLPGVVPQLEALPGTYPLQGTVLTMLLSGLGNGTFGTLSAGLSNSTWNGQPLPFDLAPFGMAGCPLLIDPLVTVPMVAGDPETLEYLLEIPVAPALTGLTLHQQALLFDASAPGGIGATSNACTLVVQ